MRRVLTELHASLRALRRQPGSSLLIALTIGVAAGPLVVALALASPPTLAARGVASPERLVRIGGTVGRSGPTAPVGQLSFPEYAFVARHQVALSGLFAATSASLLEIRSGTPEPVDAGFVTEGFFTTLGVRFALGAAWDSAAAGEPVAVISEAYWRARFDRDPAVIGREVQLQGASVRVVGVTATGFDGIQIGRPQGIWLPLRLQPLFADQLAPLDAWDALEYTAVGRLPAGSAIERVRTDLARGAEQLALDRPITLRDRALAVDPLEQPAVRRGGPAVALERATWALALIVLALAAFNVAGILLVRAIRDSHSTAVRLALGLSLRRLAVSSALQAAMLSALGLGIALLIGTWSIALIRQTTGGAITGSIGLHTLSVAVVILLAFSAIMALVPVTAWRSIPLHSALTLGGRADDVRSRGASTLLVALQVAVSGVVACAALVLGRGIDDLRRADPGFSTTGLWAVTLDLRSRDRPLDAATVSALKRDLPRTIAEWPGVSDAALGRMPLLLHGAAVTDQVSVDGSAPGPVAVDAVGPGYFSALGIRLVSGTAHAASGIGGAPDDVVVNRSFAKRYWPSGDGVGRVLQLHRADGTTRTLRAVGVVEDFRSDFVGRDLEPRIFKAALHEPFIVGFLYVRASSAPDVGRSLEREVARLIGDPVTPPTARPVEDLREESLSFLRNAFLVANALGVLSMTLAIGGVFGLQSFAAVRRRREFGIRLALGARPLHLVRLMFADAAKAVLSGIVIATPAVFIFSRVLGAVVPGVEGIDATIVLGVLAVLLAVVLAGSAWPTVQALRNDPLASIRDA